MTTVSEQTLTIDGVPYQINSLSDNAKQQIFNLRAADQEIARLQRQLAITQTARASYAQALKVELQK